MNKQSLIDKIYAVVGDSLPNTAEEYNKGYSNKVVPYARILGIFGTWDRFEVAYDEYLESIVEDEPEEKPM